MWKQAVKLTWNKLAQLSINKNLQAKKGLEKLKILIIVKLMSDTKLISNKT